MTPEIYHGDCQTVMRQLIDEGVQCDSAVMDPPYHLQSIVDRFGGDDAAAAQIGATGAFSRTSAGFMGQGWDGEDAEGRRIAFEVETWRLVYQLLKPGAFLLAFGATRTQHRMVCAIEDAGFEIRDLGAWLYANGFPKAREMGRDIDGLQGNERPVVGKGRSGPAMKLGGENDRDWHAEQAADGGKFDRTGPGGPDSETWDDWRTALKPALEVISFARKPCDQSSVARNVLMHGCGAMNIGGCRIQISDPADEAEMRRKTLAAAASPNPRRNQVYKGDDRKREEYDARGRFPANVMHDGSAEVVGLFPGSKACRTPSLATPQGTILGGARSQGAIYGDDGSAARFFFSAKADSSDRVNRCKVCSARSIKSEPRCHPDDDGEPQTIRHPTVKPLDLMRWLVRLVTRPGGTVLDCFAGTGSTGIAADREGMGSILIEQSADFVGDIRYRLAELAGGNTPLFGGGA